jgi:hypothetical protein
VRHIGSLSASLGDLRERLRPGMTRLVRAAALFASAGVPPCPERARQLIDKRPVRFNLRYYHDYEFENHLHGDSTLVSR